MLALAVVGTFLAFLLSASAGFGGSLILVPTLGLLFGGKQAVAISATLLACNNLGKVWAYRSTLPWRAALGTLALNCVGAGVGARLLLQAPESLVAFGVVSSVLGTLAMERLGAVPALRRWAPLAALAAGATSGFTGTSGPLKGVALRSLALDRRHMLGAASLVSLGGDLTKAYILIGGSLLGGEAWLAMALALPLVPVAAMLGRHLNERVGEDAFSALFWTVMAGYSLRLIGQLTR